MPREKHLHVYRRLKNSKTTFYCTELNCFHNIQKDMLRGKKGICPFCRGEMVYDAYSLKLATPICLKCRTSKVNEDHKTALAAIGNLFNKADAIPKEDHDANKPSEA
jgi:hypothetical protein